MKTCLKWLHFVAGRSASTPEASPGPCLGLDGPLLKLQIKDRTGRVRQRMSSVMLPMAYPVPKFLTWQYLHVCELAPDQGRPMFYSDDIGETVLASDDEDAVVVRPRS